MFRKPLVEQGGEGLFAAPALRLSQKKRSLRALCAHNERTCTNRTSCAGTPHVPFVECSSCRSQNTGDESGGEDGGEERRPDRACPRDAQSSPDHRWTHRLSDALFSFRPREERLAASSLLLASRWTSTAASDNPLRRWPPNQMVPCMKYEMLLVASVELRRRRRRRKRRKRSRMRRRGWQMCW